MLITKQKTFRRFWYPIVPMEMLKEGPQPFTLMGDSIVLWADTDGTPHAAIDRCCHRNAKLSIGWVDTDGCITCPYHGWRFDGSGQCRSVPQIGDKVPNHQLKIKAYQCEEKYGYAWVCLSDDPIDPIPTFEEAGDPEFRQVFEFYERWDAASLRLMENSFDAAHIAFVHKDSFGDINKPIPEIGKLYKTESGSFYMINKNRVDNTKVDRSVTGEDTDETYRTTRTDFYPPAIRKSKIHYPGGLIHSIVTCATPIADGAMQLCQWVYRNDTEEDVPAADVVSFDRRVTLEDRHILESCDPDVPIDQSRRAELHMASDRPGMLIRKILNDLLEANGEKEIYGSHFETYETPENIEYRKTEVDPVEMPEDSGGTEAPIKESL